MMGKTFNILSTIILIFTFVTNSQAAPIADIMDSEERWKTLMDLVNKEIQTIKGNKYSGPELKHRLFELYSEKIKLIRQKENELFLKSNGKKKKEDAFKSSTDQFNAAETYGLSVIKKYPDYKKLNHIYYSLAMNSRDFDDSKKTESFLKAAIQKSTNDKDILYNAKVGLAEHYYNNKRYADASQYYGEVLKNTENEWYAKHLFNAGWCHLKQRDFKSALNHLIMSFEASKRPKIVSMNDQILNAAGLFYIQADQYLEGIRFYQKNTTAPSFYLIQMAKYSTSKNNFNVTDEILASALEDSKKRKDVQAQVDVHQTQLDIYRENKKIEQFYATSESLKTIYINKKLSTDDQFVTTNKIKEFAGFLQVNLVKDKNKEKIDYNKNELKHIIAFFDILTVLDTKQTNLYHYYQAETFLSVHDFKGAFRYYQRAVLFSKKQKDSGDITKKSLESILSTLEHVKLKKKSEDKIVVFAIANYLLFYPQSEKSKTFYQKLFSIQFNKKQLKKSLNTLMVYKHYYDEDIKIHREMLTQILEHRIQKKQTNKIAFWVNKIDNGFLKFDSEYIQKSIRILGSLLFEKYQALEKQGKIKEALAGYESIFENKKYPKQTKAESAFAISLIMIQQNKSEDSKEWLTESLKLYDQSEIDKIAPSLLQLSKGQRLLQNFKHSSDIAESIMQKFCEKNISEKQSAIEIIIENTLTAEKTVIDLNGTFAKYKSCGITAETERKMVLKTFHHALFTNDSKLLLSLYSQHGENPEISRLFNQFVNFEIWENEKEYANIFQGIGKDQNRVQDERLIKTEAKFLKIKELLTRIESMKAEITIDESSAFNEDSFNTNLEEKFVSLNNYTEEAKKTLKDANLTESFLVRNALRLKTRTLAQSLLHLKAHPSMDKNYADGFLGQMREFGMELNKKSLNLENEAKTILTKNSHFTKHGKAIVQKENMSREEEVTNLMTEHYAKFLLNTIDKKTNMASQN